MSVGRIISLGSSSEGNSVYVELLSKGLDKPFSLLIDCGFAYNELLRRFIKNKIDINEIDAVLVTHEHQDHSQSVPKLLERGVKIFAPQSVFPKSEIANCNNYIALKEYTPEYLSKDNITVFPLPLEHYDNGQRITNYGYVISIDKSYRILYVTDTKYIPQDLSAFKFDLIFIEANYLEDKVMWSLRDAYETKNRATVGRYSRLVDSHMSLENLARTLTGEINENAKPFDLSNCGIIVLLHLSSGSQTNRSYYKEFLKKYLHHNRDAVKLNDNLKVVIAKKEGGFL